MTAAIFVDVDMTETSEDTKGSSDSADDTDTSGLNSLLGQEDPNLASDPWTNHDTLMDKAEVSYLGDGDDSISAGSADDFLHGGDGSDMLSGASGNDVLHGGRDGDEVLGGSGDDQLFGHVGDDLMYGGDGDDQITGGAGDDWLVGGAGDDVLTGYLGNDVVIGGAGADLIKGGDGNDIVDGRSDDTRDYLNGGAGDDILHVGAMDYANGGTGADVFAIDLAADATVDDYDPNSDVIELTYSDQAPDLTTTVDDNGITLHADGQAVVTLLGVKTLDLGAIRLTPLPPVAA